MSQTKHPESYEGTVVAVGNSRGMRLPAGFFHAHPEFEGKVQLTVIAGGAVLVSPKSPPHGKISKDEGDPVLVSFLQFMERQMTEHPEDIVAADKAVCYRR